MFSHKKHKTFILNPIFLFYFNSKLFFLIINLIKISIQVLPLPFDSFLTSLMFITMADYSFKIKVEDWVSARLWEQNSKGTSSTELPTARHVM